MNINSVGFAFVTFGVGTNGKRRPVLITYVDDEIVKFLSITSKYASKSENIKKQYYPIEDWQEIGLSKESWIDICSIKEFERESFSIEYIGDLTTNDISGLAKFTERFISNKS